MTSEAGTTGTGGILTSEFTPDFSLKGLIFTTQSENIFVIQLKEIIFLQDKEKSKGKYNLEASLSPAMPQRLL